MLSKQSTRNRYVSHLLSNIKIRQQLAETLEAVLAQTLMNRTLGGGWAFLKFLLANDAVRNVIREGKNRNYIA